MAIKKRTCVIDIESNGFTEDLLDFSSFPYKFKSEAKLWCVVIRDLETGEEWWAEKEDVTKEWVREHLAPFYNIVAHNGIKFDLPQMFLFGVLDYTIGYHGKDTIFGRECKFYDSLILSRLANPDRFGGHSLKAWGKRTSNLKDDYRQQCIEAGYIDAKDPKGAEFEKYNPLMLPYCKQDCNANADAFKAIISEFVGHDWGNSVDLEHKLADLAVSRELLGFDFDKEYALECLEDLNNKMKELADRVEPLIPPKPLNQTELKHFTPPKKPVKQNGELSSHMIKFLSRVGAEMKDDGYVFKGKFYSMDNQEPLLKSVPAQMKDFDHIKMYLIELGWNPIEWSERDMTKDSKKKNLSFEKRVDVLDRWWKDVLNGKYYKHRLEAAVNETLRLKKFKDLDDVYEKLKDKLEDKWPVKVYTSPKIKVGVTKELCPNLVKLGEKVSFAKDFADWLTYRHRRNAIAGSKQDEYGDPVTGFLSAYREQDGRIGTPAIEIGASCVTRDSRLITTDGYKRIIDVKKGDMVLTHEGVYSKVIDTIDNGIKPIYEIILDNDLKLTCTGNHPFLTQKGWVIAEELEECLHSVYTYGEIEKWGVHPAFTNYKVSSHGIILNKKGEELKPLTSKIPGEPYTVDLYDGEGKKNRISVGKLVCETFKGICPVGLETRHLDGNSKNNNIQNLKFGTSKENKEDKNKHKNFLKRRIDIKSKLSDEKVEEIRNYFKNNPYKRGDDTKMCKQYGISREFFRQIRIGKRRIKYDQYKETFKLKRIKSIKLLESEPTYDITVENQHSYVVNGIVTHNTNRYTHKIVANIPRAASIYGKEMRSLFRAGKDAVFFGFDYSSLENRIQGHYIYKYPGGPEMAESLVAEKPNDSHSLNSKKLGIPRSEVKSFTYAVLYGSAAPKIQKMLGVSLEKAKQLIDEFWEGNPALRDLKKNLEKYWESTGKKFILGIDGRKIRTRSKHSLLNALFQSGGVIFAKYVTVALMEEMESQGMCISPLLGKPDICSMIEYHDEQDMYANPKLFKFKVFDTEEEAENFVKNWEGNQLSPVSEGKNGKYFVTLPSKISIGIENCVEKITKKLKINVDMGFEYMVGSNWYQCH